MKNKKQSLKGISQKQLVNRLMQKNIKGGAANGCPPPFGSKVSYGG